MPQTLNYRSNPTVKVDLWPHEGALKGDLFVIHGGGWSGGDRGGKAGDIAKKAAKNGFRSWSLDHRLTPTVRWPEIMDDVLTCINFCEAHVAGGSQPMTRKLGWGWSAGAHLMAWACINGWVEKAVICSGPLDLLNRPTNPDIDALCLNSGREAASPILNLVPATKPMFMSYGQNDPNQPLPDALSWFNALQAMRPAPDVWRPNPDGHTWDGLSDTQAKAERGAAFNWLVA